MMKKIGIFLICALLVSGSTTLAFKTYNRNELHTKLGFFNLSQVYLSNTNVWMKTFDRTIFDFGCWTQQTNDGGYIIIGFTISFVTNDSDIWLVKTDTYGNKVWDKTFGGEDWEFSSSVQQTIDGGYIITGSIVPFGSKRSVVWLIKTNSDGIEEWNRTFGGSDFDDGGYSVRQTADEGYIILGSTGYSNDKSIGHVLLIKTNDNGIEEWNRTFGGKDDDEGYSVEQTIDGGYIITGTTYSYDVDHGDVWLIKTDFNGVEMWNKTFGGKNDDVGSCVKQTIDGGYIITGSTVLFGANLSDVWLIKTNSDGIEEWNRTFGGSDFDDLGYCVDQTNDKGYIISGETTSLSSMDTYVYLVKTDVNGNKMWNITFKGQGVNCGTSVQQTSDDGYIIGGFTGSNDIDYLLIKTDSQGKSKTQSLGYLWFDKFIHHFPFFEKIIKQNL